MDGGETRCGTQKTVKLSPSDKRLRVQITEEDLVSFLDSQIFWSSYTALDFEVEISQGIFLVGNLKGRGVSCKIPHCELEEICRFWLRMVLKFFSPNLFPFKLCVNGCGFYGTPQWKGRCSKCWRSYQMQEKKTQDYAKNRFMTFS